MPQRGCLEGFSQIGGDAILPGVVRSPRPTSRVRPIADPVPEAGRYRAATSVEESIPDVRHGERRVSDHEESLKSIVGGRIAAFFNPHGTLEKHSPKDWALRVSQQAPLSDSTRFECTEAHFSIHRQAINAENTLAKDQKRSDEELLRASVERHRALTLGGGQEDQQHHRQFKLLFEPLEYDPSIIPKELFVELQGEMNRLRYTSPGAPKTLSNFKHLARMANFSKVRDTSITRQVSSEEIVGPKLENGEWVNLYSIFQRYVNRVTPTESVDMMSRSTWFRFLHHCGLLGPEGVITFTKGSSLFDRFSEQSCGVAVLPFSNWVNSIHYIQQTLKEIGAVNANLFGILLSRCEARLNDTSTTPRRLSRTNKLSHASGNDSDRHADCGPFGWQCALAEEQMCEPEVLQLLHEYEDSLRCLFVHFAKRDEPVTSPAFGRRRSFGQLLCTVPRVESEEWFVFEEEKDEEAVGKSAQPQTAEKHERGTNSKRRSSPGRIEENQPAEQEISLNWNSDGGVPSTKSLFQRCGVLRMSINQFIFMLDQFQFFPHIVQWHSVHHHVEISVARRGVRDFTYTAFVECLCRICFVFLSIYGNSVQQASTSKRKFLWMIAMLRQGCQTCDIEKPALWRRSKCNLDAMPLRRLVLWRALDAGCSQWT